MSDNVWPPLAPDYVAPELDGPLFLPQADEWVIEMLVVENNVNPQPAQAVVTEQPDNIDGEEDNEDAEGDDERTEVDSPEDDDGEGMDETEEDDSSSDVPTVVHGMLS